jgi:TFIIF-interacting CTD phosphatase-like protein
VLQFPNHNRLKVAQVDNGIPIKSWFGTAEESGDDRLPLLMPFLTKLSTARDVRPLVRKRFQMQQRLDQHGARAGSGRR